MSIRIEPGVLVLEIMVSDKEIRRLTAVIAPETLCGLAWQLLKQEADKRELRKYGTLDRA